MANLFTSLQASESATGGILLKRCSRKFRNTQRKSPGAGVSFQPAALLKRDPTGHNNSCFPVNFEKLLRTSFSQNTSRQLILKPL